MEQDIVDLQETVSAGSGVQALEETPAWVESLTAVGLNLIAAIVIFVVGRIVARVLKDVLIKAMEKSKVDPVLISFAGNLGYSVLMVFVILAALARLGIQTTSFVAIIGAAGLAIGLALQGSLSNFAAGVLMLIFRPFKLGDFVEAGGISGIVKEIHIFTTTFKTPDNKRVIVPNSKVMGDNITNYSAEGTRRVDLVASISYADDIDKAKEALMDEVKKDARVLADPAPVVAVVKMADSSIDLVVRPWTNVADYWGVYFDLTENMKKRIEAEGMSIPFPQRDVHIYQET